MATRANCPNFTGHIKRFPNMCGSVADVRVMHRMVLRLAKFIKGDTITKDILIELAGCIHLQVPEDN